MGRWAASHGGCVTRSPAQGFGRRRLQGLSSRAACAGERKAGAASAAAKAGTEAAEGRRKGGGLTALEGGRAPVGRRMALSSSAAAAAAAAAAGGARALSLPGRSPTARAASFPEVRRELTRACAGGGEAAGFGSIPRTSLGDLEISRVIKGNWQLAGGHGAYKEEDAIATMFDFANAGITTFDTADIYGPSEAIVGKFLDAFNRGGGQRCQMQVMTKLCYFGPEMASAAGTRGYARQIVQRSLQRLGQDKLDVVQLYWGDYNLPNYIRAAEEMAEMQSDGLIGHVSVTNFDVQHLKDIVDAGVKITHNQVQYSLIDRRPENGMLDFCGEHGIQLTPFGTVAGSFLTDQYLGTDPGRVTLDTSSKKKYAGIIQRYGGWDTYQELLRTLRAVADSKTSKDGSLVSIANVASRWVLARPMVAGVIVGARNSNHVADHGRMFDFDLTEGDLAAIDKVLAKSTPPVGDCNVG